MGAMKLTRAAGSQVASGAKPASSTTAGNGKPHVLADQTIAAIAEEDWETLSQLVHPQHGVRFSPYAQVDLKSDVVLSRKEVAGLSKDTKVRKWGMHAFSGEPLELKFQEYRKKYIYDGDYAQATRDRLKIVTGSNLSEVFGAGSNLPEVFRDREVDFFEYFVPETKAGKKDWRRLRLVFERTNSKWYLVGVVHSDYTSLM